MKMAVISRESRAGSLARQQGLPGAGDAKAGGGRPCGPLLDGAAGSVHADGAVGAAGSGQGAGQARSLDGCCRSALTRWSGRLGGRLNDVRNPLQYPTPTSSGRGRQADPRLHTIAPSASRRHRAFPALPGGPGHQASPETAPARSRASGQTHRHITGQSGRHQLPAWREHHARRVGDLSLRTASEHSSGAYSA
jgi:hypothetical protein